MATTAVTEPPSSTDGPIFVNLLTLSASSAHQAGVMYFGWNSAAKDSPTLKNLQRKIAKLASVPASDQLIILNGRMLGQDTQLQEQLSQGPVASVLVVPKASIHHCKHKGPPRWTICADCATGYCMRCEAASHTGHETFTPGTVQALYEKVKLLLHEEAPKPKKPRSEDPPTVCMDLSPLNAEEMTAYWNHVCSLINEDRKLGGVSAKTVQWVGNCLRHFPVERDSVLPPNAGALNPEIRLSVALLEPENLPKRKYQRILRCCYDLTLGAATSKFTMFDRLEFFLAAAPEGQHYREYFSSLVMRCGGAYRENWLPNPEPPEKSVILRRRRG
jgi:hypothetical protein